MENRIREIRQRKNLTLDQLAQRAGTIASTIEKLEKGRRNLTVGWMRRIAKALSPGVSPADLLANDDNPGRLQNERESELVNLLRRLDDAHQAKLLARAMLLWRAQEGLITEAEMEPNLPGYSELFEQDRDKPGRIPGIDSPFSEDVE